MNNLQHLALIMDGNGRWAQLRGRPRIHGHIRGTRVAKNIILHANKCGLKYLTLYAFSTENWSRPIDEVSFLMKLLERYLKNETENLVKQNIQFDTIGDIQKVPEAVQQQIRNARIKTQGCTGLKVIFALSYGAREEIVKTIQKIASDYQNGSISLAQLNEDYISENLMTSGTPDPDLIIRTSGEKRLSNFLLWQSAYSEFYFTDKLWPDFTQNDFDIAVLDFSKRQRRYGRSEVDSKAILKSDRQSSHEKQSNL
jgi:undecaprenyl diphosphate synthase